MVSVLVRGMYFSGFHFISLILDVFYKIDIHIQSIIDN